MAIEWLWCPRIVFAHTLLCDVCDAGTSGVAELEVRPSCVNEFVLSLRRETMPLIRKNNNNK